MLEGSLSITLVIVIIVTIFPVAMRQDRMTEFDGSTTRAHGDVCVWHQAELTVAPDECL
jgi:hypothetical protein